MMDFSKAERQELSELTEAVAVELLDESEIPSGLRHKLGRSIQGLRDIFERREPAS